jgi:methyl-accepting chemotaxis protein
MNVKTRIWLLPIVAALIFAVGVVTVFGFSSHTSSLIRSLGAVDYPFLDAITQFDGQLEALGGVIQSAVAEGEKKRLDDAAERAANARKLLVNIKALPGKAEEAELLARDFDAYYMEASRTARLFLGIEEGDQGAAVGKMQAALKTLQATVKKERNSASENFNNGLLGAERGVSASLWAIVVSAVVVVAALGVGSFLVIGGV